MATFLSCDGGPADGILNAGRLGTEGLIETKTNRGHPKGGLLELTNFFEPTEHNSFDTFAPNWFDITGNMEGIKNCLYADNPEDNVWEYYFHPVSEFTVEQALKGEHLISDIFQVPVRPPNELVAATLGKEDASLDISPAPSGSTWGEFLCSKEGENTQIIGSNINLISNLRNYHPTVMHQYHMAAGAIAGDPQTDDDEKQRMMKRLKDICDTHRQFIHNLMKRYIRIKTPILEKAREFGTEHWLRGAPMMGVHVRGTDKCGERHEDINTGIRGYITEVDYFLHHNPRGKIFLATDAEEVVSTFRVLYGDRLVVCPSKRVQSYNNGLPAPLTPGIAGRSHGEETLIEALLLSKCDYFVGSDSNMSTMVLYFNPQVNYTVYMPGERIWCHDSGDPLVWSLSLLDGFNIISTLRGGKPPEVRTL